MLYARVNTPRYVGAYYQYSGSLATPTFLITAPDGDEVATLAAASSSTLANIYLSSSTVEFSLVGIYGVELQEAGTTVWRDIMVVGMDPTSAYEVGTTVYPDFYLPENVVGNSTDTVSVSIINSADLEVYSGFAPYTSEGRIFVATSGPLAEGMHFVLWYSNDGGGNALKLVEEKYGLVPKGYEDVVMYVYATAGSSAVPYTDTTVLITRVSDELPVAQEVTNGSGRVSMPLPPDEYYVTLRKTDYVFTKNNARFTVVDTSGSDDENLHEFETSHLEATFDSDPAELDMATLFATLYKFDGEPLRDTEILISLVQGPENYSGIGAFGTSKIVKTNKNGYVEFRLLQGITVEISILTFSLRRTITVPSGAPAQTPTNFLDLLSAATEDPFDILIPNIPSVVRRSL